MPGPYGSYISNLCLDLKGLAEALLGPSSKWASVFSGSGVGGVRYLLQILFPAYLSIIFLHSYNQYLLSGSFAISADFSAWHLGAFVNAHVQAPALEMLLLHSQSRAMESAF